MVTKKISTAKFKRARKSVAYWIFKGKLDDDYTNGMRYSFKEAFNLGKDLDKQGYKPDFSVKEIEVGTHLAEDIIETDLDRKQRDNKKKSFFIRKGEQIKEEFDKGTFKLFALKTKYDCFLFQYGGVIYIYYPETKTVYVNLANISDLKGSYSSEIYDLMYCSGVFNNNTIDFSKQTNYIEIELPFSERNLQKMIHYEGYNYLLGDIAKIDDLSYHPKGAGFKNRFSVQSIVSFNSMKFYCITDWRKVIWTDNDYIN